VFAVSLLILGLGGCSNEPKPGKPFFGLASHYGPEWDGRLTSTGEVFHNSELTAAHKTLPFGTKVKVTLLSTQKSVVVRINDRGPFIKGRVIDLSDEAARRIGLDRYGVAEVEMQILELGHDKYISPKKRRAMAEEKKRKEAEAKKKAKHSAGTKPSEKVRKELTKKNLV
jgi:rare lipoprotein A